MKILLHRKGAMGDVMCTTPVARRLRLENPRATIHVQTFHHEVFWNNPYIDAILDPNERLGAYDRVIDLTMVYESTRKLHPIDSFFMSAFGDTNGDKSFFLSHPSGIPQYRQLANIDWTRAIILHPNTSWPSRTLPPNVWQAITDLLVRHKYHVVITGTGMDIPPTGPNTYDLRGKLSLSHQATIIAKSRCALFGQSGMTAIAGATDTPLVSFYTITRPEFEIPYRHGELGWNSHAIQTSLPCFACYEDYPSAEYYECRLGTNACVTSSFDPNLVLETVIQAIETDQRKFL